MIVLISANTLAMYPVHASRHHALTWNLDPGSFVCSPMLTLRPPVDCGVPDPPVNGSFVGAIEDTSEDSMIFYRCNDGLFPMGNLHRCVIVLGCGIQIQGNKAVLQNNVRFC